MTFTHKHENVWCHIWNSKKKKKVVVTNFSTRQLNRQSLQECGKVVRDVWALHPQSGDTPHSGVKLLLHHSRWQTHGEESFFSSEKNLKRTSNWPPASQHLGFTFRAHTHTQKSHFYSFYSWMFSSVQCAPWQTARQQQEAEQSALSCEVCFSPPRLVIYVAHTFFLFCQPSLFLPLFTTFILKKKCAHISF